MVAVLSVVATIGNWLLPVVATNGNWLLPVVAMNGSRLLSVVATNGSWLLPAIVANDEEPRNHSKTEVLWFSFSHLQHRVPTSPRHIVNDSVMPVSSVQDLGDLLDSGVSMRSRVTMAVKFSFDALRRRSNTR